MSGNEVKIKLSLTDNVSKQLTKVGKGFDKIGGKGSGAVFFGTMGSKLVSKGFDLIGQAANGAVGFIEDSIQAARDAEISENRLALALHNNVKGWKSNTDAIEERLTANMRLGFSDDEQRDSMSKLITATGNVHRSFKILGVAMDVARFKAIPLGTATDLVWKALMGSKRALKELGIELPKTATKGEILHAIQQKLRGSAENYATTLDGKVAIANANFAEAQEKLGKIIIPAVTTAMGNLANMLLYLSGDPSFQATGVLKDIENAANKAFRGVDILGDALRDLKNSQGGDFSSGTWKPSPGHKGADPKNSTTSVPGVKILGLSEKQILAMVDKGLYFQLRRAGTAA